MFLTLAAFRYEEIIDIHWKNSCMLFKKNSVKEI